MEQITESAPASAPSCLRCAGVVLERIEQMEAVSFWRCPGCERQFMCHEDGVVTERWAGPIGLVLYNVIFARDPRSHAARIVAGVEVSHLSVTLAEIERELEHPTQPVSRILGRMASSEDELRLYLRDVAVLIRARLDSGCEDRRARFCFRRWRQRGCR